MKSVKQLIEHKTLKLLKTNPDSTVYDALKLMAENDVGALVVIDRNELIGIFSERDYARKVILQGKSSRDTHVKEIMTTKVMYVGPENTVDECMALMTQKRIRHLPVMETNQVTGMISIGDIVKEKLSEQQFIIDQLEQYIKG